MRSRPDGRGAVQLPQCGRAALLVSILMVAISVAGCSSPSAPVVDESSAAAPAETKSAEELAAEAARTSLRAACSKFDASMSTFADTSRVASSVESYADALKKLAFALGDQAIDAADAGGSGIDVLLANLASGTAAFADEYVATGEASTARWLAFRTGVKAVGDACGQTWDFED